MSKILVSVVVPIYNASATLVRCIDTIVNQTFATHMEIILVDDGSTDDSGCICDSFAANYDNVRVIHQPNAGMGAAYNNGISIARGEYIGLVESDDFIVPNMYQIMYNNAKQNDSDLVKCGIYYLYDWQKFLDNGAISLSNWEDFIINQITSGPQPFTISDHKILLAYHSSVWATLYRSDFIKQIQFSTQPDASYQDFFFMIKCLVLAKRISAVPERLYFWNLENEASSTNRNDERLMRIMDQANLAKDWLRERGQLNEFLPEFCKQSIIAMGNFYEKIRPDLAPIFLEKMHRFFMDVCPYDLSNVIKYMSPPQIELLKQALSYKA